MREVRVERAIFLRCHKNFVRGWLNIITIFEDGFIKC